jgi:CCR4-NOT complex subunit CAF16
MPTDDPMQVLTQPSPLPHAIETRRLDFTYPEGEHVLRGLDLTVPTGARCLLVGANGSGKTTLLTLLAGRHMVSDDAVRVLGRPAFADTSLVNDVSFIGGQFPLDVDVSVAEMLSRRSEADPARVQRLLDVLAIDRRWRMSRVSDGQRRRVQLLLGLLWPYRLLLLDEVTTDLDVIARGDLLQLLRDESDGNGTTIFYATHILDGLEQWATHLAYLAQGRIQLMQPLAAIAELTALQEARAPAPLLRLVDRWLRAEPRAEIPRR